MELAAARAARTLERSAWNAARALDIPDAAFEKLAHAYAVGADLNARVEMVERNLTAIGGAIDSSTNAGQQAIAHQTGLVDQATRTAKQAHDAFVAARETLGWG